MQAGSSVRDAVPLKKLLVMTAAPPPQAASPAPRAISGWPATPPPSAVRSMAWMPSAAVGLMNTWRVPLSQATAAPALLLARMVVRASVFAPALKVPRPVSQPPPLASKAA